MTSYLIPNAGNTTSGNRFSALDQAEPDTVDYSILGNIGRSGVFSGLEVTANDNATDVSVTGGAIILNGRRFAVSGNASLGIPAAPADVRFDLVVARTSGSSASLFVVEGTNSATNPVFPASRDVITGTFDPATNVDFDTDVVLAAVYRDGGAAVNDADIVDKRVFKSSSIEYQGTSVPGDGTSPPGTLFYLTPSPTGITDSGVYVANTDGTWSQLVKVPTDGGPFWPIGMVGIWPGRGSLPEGYFDCNGDLHAVATYPEAAGILGTVYGGNGTTTFGVPDYAGVGLRGSDSNANVGNSLGQDTVSLTVAHLPPHSHPMEHVHGMEHEHPIWHIHDQDQTSPAGSHHHGPGTLAVVGVGGRNPMLREPTYSTTPFVTGSSGLNPANWNGKVYIINEDSGPTSNLYFGAGMAVSQVGQLVVSGVTTSVSAHYHDFVVQPYVGNSGPSTEGTTDASTEGTTGETGGGSSFSNIPASKKVRYVIRLL